MTDSPVLRLVACCIGGVLASCSSAIQEAPTRPPSPVMRASDSVYVARARADSARLPYTVADIQFMTRMIGHHAQAVRIARWAPTHGASASVRTLAARIINAQEDEIATMRQWLRDRLQPVPEPDAADHSIHAEHDASMHGMLTAAQLRELDAARGTQFDRLFLSLMIQHHRGAVEMVKELFGSYGAAQDETVFKFASDVNVDQSTEIERMEKMLAALPPTNQP